MRISAALVALSVVGAGCGDDGNDAAPGVDASVTDASAGSGLYEAAGSYEYDVRVPAPLTYTDVSGAPREVPFALYVPRAAPLPMPIVLVSHGGSDGKTNPLTSLPEWAETFARAGFLTVAIAHGGRSAASYTALCADVGYDPALTECGFKINWDRPHDLTHVLARLEQLAATPQLQGMMDLDHIGYLGHSAGAGAAMMAAGARRNYYCSWPFATSGAVPCDPAMLVSRRQPRISAVVAMSPQGPLSDGFMSESFSTVEIPVLVATGQRDGSVADGEPANRTSLFPLLPAGGKYLLYVDDPGAVHTLFGGELAGCSAPASRDRCEEMRRWLFSAATALFDAELRERAEGRAWLGSDAIESASQGTATWTRR